MSAPLAGKFQDHYKVLGVEPTADAETIHRAYSQLASKYHAKNKETADPEKFSAVTQAYEVLADPTARSMFDTLRAGPEKEEDPRFSGPEFFRSLVSEIVRRQSILCVLYDRRRQQPARPGLSMRQLESMMVISADELQFSVWYLKQRGLVASDDKSNLQVTVQGMEAIERDMPPAETILGMFKVVGSRKAPHAPTPDAPAAR